VARLGNLSCGRGSAASCAVRTRIARWGSKYAFHASVLRPCSFLPTNRKLERWRHKPGLNPQGQACAGGALTPHWGTPFLLASCTSEPFKPAAYGSGVGAAFCATLLSRMSGSPSSTSAVRGRPSWSCSTRFWSLRIRMLVSRSHSLQRTISSLRCASSPRSTVMTTSSLRSAFGAARHSASPFPLSQAVALQPARRRPRSERLLRCRGRSRPVATASIAAIWRSTDCVVTRYLSPVDVAIS
jgi:hypothetical protein